MRRIIPFFIFFFIFFNVRSEIIFSELNLKLYNNGSFNLILDNQTFQTPSNNFCFRSILPGQHFIQVYYSPHINSLPDLIYSGVFTIPYNARMLALIDYNRVFTVVNVMPLYNNFPEGSYNNFYHPDHTPDQFSYIPYNCLDSNSYNHLKAAVSKGHSSKMKLAIAKHGITFNKVRADQVAEMMLMLDFEVERLELAKYAYYFTIDKHNYYKVNQSFIFSGSAIELNKCMYNFY